MQKLSMWTAGDEDFVIAADLADARAVMREQGGGHGLEDDAYQRLPDDAVFPFAKEEDGPTIKKTCAEWAAEHGRGHFATSTDA